MANEGVDMRLGEGHPRSKLTGHDVHQIRELVQERDKHLFEAAKLTNQKIAEKFDIHEGHVRRIASRKNWSHV